MLRQWLKEARRELVLEAHGTGRKVVLGPRKELVDQPLTPAAIEGGEPRPRGYCAVSSADGGMHAGEWECNAGRFRWTYHEDEFIRILEGAAEIEIDGTFRKIGPGDTVFFPMGQVVRWHVPVYIRKTFFISHPGRVVQFLRTFKVF
jgi:uncharacterized cupin superfamily protein